jgi:hypothetical protein
VNAITSHGGGLFPYVKLTNSHQPLGIRAETCVPGVRSDLGTDAQPIVAAQIVQTTGDFKPEIDILVSPIAKDITCDMEDFRTTNTVFDPHWLS